LRIIKFTAVTTTTRTTSRHADLPLIRLLIFRGSFFRGLYVYPVKPTEISSQLKI
jgi:hypothetical protein